jgi:hypothetical protein
MKVIQETRHAHYVRYLQFCYYGELGRFPLSVDIKQRMVSYWTKLIFFNPPLVYKVLRIPYVCKPTFIKNTFDISQPLKINILI